MATDSIDRKTGADYELDRNQTVMDANGSTDDQPKKNKTNKDLGKEISHHTSNRIALIEGGSEARAKAILANLRRGVGKNIQTVPEIWGTVLEDMPDDLIEEGDKPSAAENAVFIAMTLYALAMQGHSLKTDSAHEAGISLGGAAGRYGRKTGEEKRILTRLQKIITANSVEQIQNPLRSVIQLLHQANIGLDYAGLAEDLFFYSKPYSRDRIRMKWARDYYQNLKPPKEDTQETAEN